MTELESVNYMLSQIGEAPVTSLTENYDEASRALVILRQITSELLHDGLHCNEEYEVELPLEVDNTIEVPATALSLDASDPTMNITVRGGNLYDLDNHTDIFSQPVKCNIKYTLDWADIPFHAQDYATKLGGLRLYSHIYGSDRVPEGLSLDLSTSKARFESVELEHGDHNFLTSPGVNDVLNRFYNPWIRRI